jgi:hypothetical protein
MDGEAKLRSLFFLLASLGTVFETLAIPYYLGLVQLAQSGIWAWHGTVLGPYGVPWYIFYHDLTLLPYRWFILALWLGNVFLTVTLSFHYPKRALALLVFGNLFLFLFPADLLLVWTMTPGRLWSSLSTVAIELPLGAPGYVWGFIFGYSAGRLFWVNLPRYLILLGFLVYPLFRRRRLVP